MCRTSTSATYKCIKYTSKQVDLLSDHVHNPQIKHGSDRNWYALYF